MSSLSTPLNNVFLNTFIPSSSGFMRSLMLRDLFTTIGLVVGLLLAISSVDRVTFEEMGIFSGGIGVEW